LLADATVRQIVTTEDGLISLYEIGETETIQEVIPKTINWSISALPQEP
jgi:hypothetical protein